MHRNVVKHLHSGRQKWGTDQWRRHGVDWGGRVHPSFSRVDFPIPVNQLIKILVGEIRYSEPCRQRHENKTLCDVTWQCGSHYDAILASKGRGRENSF